MQQKIVVPELEILGHGLRPVTTVGQARINQVVQIVENGEATSRTYKILSGPDDRGYRRALSMLYDGQLEVDVHQSNYCVIWPDGVR